MVVTRKPPLSGKCQERSTNPSRVFKLPLGELVRVPGVEPGSAASEAATLSIVLHSQITEPVAFAGAGGFQAVLQGRASRPRRAERMAHPEDSSYLNARPSPSPSSAGRFPSA